MVISTMKEELHTKKELRLEPETITFEDLWASLRRRIGLVLIVFAATVIATYVGLQFLTEQYETSASLLVKIGRENTDTPASVQNGALLATGVRKEDINSEIEMLTSRALVEQTVDTLGPAAFLQEPVRPESILGWPKYYARRAYHWVKDQAREGLILLSLKKRITPRETAVVAVKDSLQAMTDKASNVIDVHLKFPHPQLGEKVVATLLPLYLAQHTAVYQTPDVKGFFEQELQDNQRRMAELLQQRDEIRKRWRLSSVPNQEALLLKESADLQTQIVLDAGEVAALRQQAGEMRTRIAKLPQRVQSTSVQSQNPSIQAISERLATLKVEHAKMASRYQPDSEPVKKNREEIAELEAELANQPPTMTGSLTAEINPLYQSFEQDIAQNEVKIAGLVAKGRDLRGPAGSLIFQLGRLNEGADQLETIDREIKITQQNYEAYAKHREDARISEELDRLRVANVAVLSSPSTAMEPVYPRKLLIMGLSFPLGLVLAILVVLFLGYADDTVHEQRDIADLEQLMFLGTVRGNGRSATGD
jgi:uncharacterized protein involved in exopolysaccharide biosynthesis